MPDKILLVDDDNEFRSEFKDFLEGYDVVDVPDGRQALKILSRANDIGVVILDVMMPGLTGTDVLRQIKKTDPNLAIVILTGYGSKDVAIEALKGRADDYLEKPIDPEKARQIIEKLLENRPGFGNDIRAGGIDAKIEKIKRFVQINCYKKIELEDVARIACLSPKYISRVFKEHAGVSFSQYRIKLKVEKAKGLLMKSGYNINEISDKLGYENAESFIRQFKRFVSRTPTDFRLRERKKLAKTRMRRSKNISHR